MYNFHSHYIIYFQIGSCHIRIFLLIHLKQFCFLFMCIEIGVNFLSDASCVKLLRYKDNESGWRTIPQLNGAGDDKLELSPSTTFHIDTKTSTVTLRDNGTSWTTGRQLVYAVQ